MRVSKGSPENCTLGSAVSSPSGRLYTSTVLLMLVATIMYLYLDLSGDLYAQTPFCDADGTCHEKPDQPSPRTVYSAKSQFQYQRWWELHGVLNATAEAYATTRRALPADDSSRPLILLGDSITESWMGTDMGDPVSRAVEVPQVLEDLLADSPLSKLDPLILAIAGDQTQHLLYRLQNGHLLPAYANDPTAIFVVLIGTNNLGSGELPGPTAQGVLAVADYLLANTQGHLILLQNLPRGDSFRLSRICPPRCASTGHPFASFLPVVEKVNQAVWKGAEILAERHGSRRMGIMDCGKRFLADGKAKEEVRVDLMTDLLHPNAVGQRVLGECFMSYILGLEKG